jgi:hypothetical protein
VVRAFLAIKSTPDQFPSNGKELAWTLMVERLRHDAMDLFKLVPSFNAEVASTLKIFPTLSQVTPFSSRYNAIQGMCFTPQRLWRLAT